MTLTNDPTCTELPATGSMVVGRNAGSILDTSGTSQVATEMEEHCYLNARYGDWLAVVACNEVKVIRYTT